MTTATADAGLQVEATITGDVGGQVAIGQHIAQYRVESGGTLIVGAPPGQQPTCRPRPLPIALGGRRPPDLLGRNTEIQAATRALERGETVEFHGPPGIGKTCLLKYMGQAPPRATAAHGIVYHDAGGERGDDILAVLHEAFYEVPEGVKPSEADIRHDLRDIAAFIVLDDIEVHRDALEEILDALPSATFLIAGTRRTLWGGGRSVGLQGLPGEAAVELLERELGRELDAEEETAARLIAEGVGAEPLRLLEIAALLVEMGTGLSELSGRLAVGATPEEVAAMLLEKLDDDELAVLAVLTALRGATLTAEQLADLTGVEDVDAVVESLLRMRLIKANSPRYNVTDPPTLDRVVHHSQWHGDLMAHFSNWVERNADRPHAVIEERQAIVAVLARAAEAAAWQDLLRLGRAAELPFFVTKRWGGWKEVLDHQLTAAERIGDRSAQAWAHHQLGSRALCLGDRVAALNHLSRALVIREALGDHTGAATTRHNLSLLAEGDRRRPEGAKPAATAVLATAPLAGLPLLAVLLGLAAVLIIVAGVIVTGFRGSGRSESATTVGANSSPVRVDPERLDFGDVAPGDLGVVQGVTVTNAGDDAVAISAVVSGGDPGTFAIASDGCGGDPLVAGASCRFEVRFTPAGPGAHRADVLVDAGAAGELRVPLNGSGTDGRRPPAGRPEPRLEPSTVDFGTRSVSDGPVRRSLAVLNAGGESMRVTSMQLGGVSPGDFSVGRDGCTGVLLPPASRCAVEVAFAPQRPGSRRAVLFVAVEGFGARLSSSLSGRGAEPTDGVRLAISRIGDQQLVYGSQVNLGVKGAYADGSRAPLTFSARDLPAGLAITQTGPDQARISGTVRAEPGRYTSHVEARAGEQVDATSFSVTVVPATLHLEWLQPLADLTLGAPATAVAVVTETTGTGADLAGLPLVFEATNTLTRGMRTLPATVAPDGRVTLHLQPGDLEAGLYTIRARLDASNDNYRLDAPAPVALALSTDVLSATLYTLSGLLSGTDI